MPRYSLSLFSSTQQNGEGAQKQPTSEPVPLPNRRNSDPLRPCNARSFLPCQPKRAVTSAQPQSHADDSSGDISAKNTISPLLPRNAHSGKHGPGTSDDSATGPARGENASPSSGGYPPRHPAKRSGQEERTP